MTTDSLFEQLKHPNPNLRERAIGQLAECQDQDKKNIISRLMDNLGEEDVVYRRASVKALGAIGQDTVTPLVESLLNSENVTVRGSAAKALAQIAINYREDPFPNEGLQGLKTALNDPNPVVHIASAMALGEIGSPAIDILLGALQNTDNPALAVSLVNALGSIGGDKVTEVLTALTDDESADSYVRESATSVLSRMEMVSGYQKVNAQRA
ncbi:MAG: HEAT repeat domain-containing protein [Moorea sp. SIO2B7]|nr:HEAT repeat domain-containing protein [Moorena sp. SIO2B7]